jgi:hypothetical protein
MSYAKSIQKRLNDARPQGCRFLYQVEETASGSIVVTVYTPMARLVRSKRAPGNTLQRIIRGLRAAGIEVPDVA